VGGRARVRDRLGRDGTAATSHDAIIDALTASGTMSAEAVRNLTTAALGLTAYLWQVAHPTPAVAELYALHPRFGHTAQEFEPLLIGLLQATATGLGAVVPRTAPAPGAPTTQHREQR